ncbi:Cilia- and flagella-associated protein 61 [Camelus dromedarius]|uniref:Cilia-and flagella-associated protein 61 n=1 Tax=Camelus dromedarius TaxID=9838 RepID=A0A5N4CUA0_CAMDR|nr:Cilia- and flagella-associated protein 61 [Camelus dromedarius]
MPTVSCSNVTDGAPASLCSHCFNDRDHAVLSLCSWVSVVVGKMTAIDRAAKRVMVSGEEVVPYDHLVLCTGLQYQVSPGGTAGPLRVAGVNGVVTRTFSEQVAESKSTTVAFMPMFQWQVSVLLQPEVETCQLAREDSDQIFEQKTNIQGKASAFPPYFFHLFMEASKESRRYPRKMKEAPATCHLLLNICKDSESMSPPLLGHVIVYGNTIDTYTTVEMLLSIGVRGSHIHLVQHPPTSTITCINNYSVESAVEDALRAAGVTVSRDALLAQWNDGQDPDPIRSASFTTPTKPFTLPCSVFFSFCEKNVDYETFKAFNDACLVYDGRLVIDTNFHTNDIAIRAAGPLTKFSNRYYSNEWAHGSFNSKEIGFQLAAAMLSLFDPTLEAVTEPPADLDRLIPMYKGAKVKGV